MSDKAKYNVKVIIKNHVGNHGGEGIFYVYNKNQHPDPANITEM